MSIKFEAAEGYEPPKLTLVGQEDEPKAEINVEPELKLKEKETPAVNETDQAALARLKTETGQDFATIKEAEAEVKPKLKLKKKEASAVSDADRAALSIIKTETGQDFATIEEAKAYIENPPQGDPEAGVDEVEADSETVADEVEVAPEPVAEEAKEEVTPEPSSEADEALLAVLNEGLPEAEQFKTLDAAQAHLDTQPGTENAGDYNVDEIVTDVESKEAPSAEDAEMLAILNEGLPEAEQFKTLDEAQAHLEKKAGDEASAEYDVDKIVAENERMEEVRQSLESKKGLESGYHPRDSHKSVAAEEFRAGFEATMKKAFNGLFTKADMAALIENTDDEIGLLARVEQLGMKYSEVGEGTPVEKMQAYAELVEEEQEATREKVAAYTKSQTFLGGTTRFAKAAQEGAEMLKVYGTERGRFESKKDYVDRMRERFDRMRGEMSEALSDSRDFLAVQYGESLADQEQAVRVNLEAEFAELGINKYYDAKMGVIQKIDDYPVDTSGRFGHCIKLGGKTMTRVAAAPFQALSKLTGGLVNINTPSRVILDEYNQAREELGTKRRGSKAEYLARSVNDFLRPQNLLQNFYTHTGNLEDSLSVQNKAEETQQSVDRGIDGILDTIGSSEAGIKTLRQRLGLKRIDSYANTSTGKGYTSRLKRHKNVLKRIEVGAKDVYEKIGGAELVGEIDQRLEAAS